MHRWYGDGSDSDVCEEVYTNCAYEYGSEFDVCGEGYTTCASECCSSACS